MIDTAAVVAHFDPDARLDETFLRVLAVLVKCCDVVLVVSTCHLAPTDYPMWPKVEVIERPNLGYDFYSYRVGVTEILRRGGARRLFMLNSSFVVLDGVKFEGLLWNMLAEVQRIPVVGVTKSTQFRPHLQSYLLALQGEVLRSDWFVEWLNSVAPQNSKLETIINGELSLSSALVKSGTFYASMLRLSAWDRFVAALRYSSVLLSARVTRGAALSMSTLLAFNPTHFAARPLAERFGLIKAELLRSNPHRINLDWVFGATRGEERDEVESFINRTRRYYVPTDQGLTALTPVATIQDAVRIVSAGRPARSGVLVCVVVHVFHPELLGEISDTLRNIPLPFDCIATTPHEGAVVDIINAIAPVAQSVRVALCENRGRDIGPFISILNMGLMSPYQAVLKLHTKRSSYSPMGDHWRKSLFRDLCGSADTVLQTLALLGHNGVGVVGPHCNYLSHPHFWGANEERGNALLRLAGTEPDSVTHGFFAGSMFWFAPRALEGLSTMSSEHLRFEEEAGQQDGTLAHAFERVFCDVARGRGFVVSSLELAGREISTVCTMHHTVPVLDAPTLQTSQAQARHLSTGDRPFCEELKCSSSKPGASLAM